jgi:hypothetical protein
VLKGTSVCQAVPINVGSDKVFLVDTPGFDDSERSDTDILTEISRILATQYELGIKLKGVIYLHRITDIRYQNSSVKTLNIFKKICGADALKNVLLVTTRWSEVDSVLGAKREKELREQFWAYMIGNGSHMARFHGDTDSAISLLSQLLSKEAVVMDIQRQLVDEGKKLNETSAGAMVDGGLEKVKAKYQQELKDLESLRNSLLESDREMKRQIQKDWAVEQARLSKLHDEQVSLQIDVAEEVRQQIHMTKTKKSSGLLKLLPLLPTVLDIFLMFVGIPPGGFSVLSSWISSSSLGDSFDEFFSNF